MVRICRFLLPTLFSQDAAGFCAAFIYHAPTAVSPSRPDFFTSRVWTNQEKGLSFFVWTFAIRIEHDTFG